MTRLAYLRPLQLKSGLLGLLLLLLACFTAGQMYQRVNPYAAGGHLMRGSYPAVQSPWAGTRWNSVQHLSNAIRAHESQAYGSGGAPAQNTQLQVASPPVQSAQPQMARIPVQSAHPQVSSSQPLPGATPSVSSQIASSQPMLRNGTAPYQTPMAQYVARNMVHRYPGVNSALQQQYNEAYNPQVTQEGATQSLYAPATGPSASPGGASNLYSSQYNGGAVANRPNGDAAANHPNGGAAANRPNGVRSNTNRPDANVRFPGSGRYTQSGRTTSSFMGIASGDPYYPYSSRGRHGNQPSTDQAGSDDTASISTGTTNEESQPTEAEEGGSSEVQSSGGLGVRRAMNPYDLSHIFPDIYQEQQPAAYENMTSQSLALLEMTTINSDTGAE